MLRGLTTVSFYAEDVEKAKRWYAEFLGAEAYFNVPGPDGAPVYTEFRVGDYQYELGIINSTFSPRHVTAKAGGAIAYWHVDDLDATLDRLHSMGASEVLGIMRNPHYLEVLAGGGNK